MGGSATPYTNRQQHTNMMSTVNHSVSKYRNQAQKVEEKQSCKEIRAHQTENGRVGWDLQIHTSRLPRMIKNHMYTRLYQAPCQLCLTTSLLATDGISHEGPRFFTLVQPWRTSISLKSLNAPGLHASSGVRGPISLHQAIVCLLHYHSSYRYNKLALVFANECQ